MTTQKDRIEAAIRHIQTASDVDPWAMELAVDALKAQGTCEDAVSRQTLQKELALYPIDDVTSEDEAGYNRAINDIQKMVLHLPSAQPELAQNLHNACTNLISRKEVIKLLDEAWVDGHEYQGWLHDEVNRLPSAQPKPCEDAVSRADTFNAINDYVKTVGVLDGYTDTQEVLRIVKRLPSAQPEIIRCKDCKHRDPEDKKCDCGHDILWQLPRQDDWYCADAERRTDE